MEMNDKMQNMQAAETAAEQTLPVQELPADIPDEVRQKLAQDLNEEATEDLKQDMREPKKRRPTTKRSRPTPKCSPRAAC